MKIELIGHEFARLVKDVSKAVVDKKDATASNFRNVVIDTTHPGEIRLSATDRYLVVQTKAKTAEAETAQIVAAASIDALQTAVSTVDKFATVTIEVEDEKVSFVIGYEGNTREITTENTIETVEGFYRALSAKFDEAEEAANSCEKTPVEFLRFDTGFIKKLPQRGRVTPVEITVAEGGKATRGHLYYLRHCEGEWRALMQGLSLQSGKTVAWKAE